MSNGHRIQRSFYPIIAVVFLYLFLTGCDTTQQNATQDEPSPNIIVILADDLGYGDLGVYGGELIKTPHIDSLANEGVRLTEFYASGNVCTPSRAGLLTGRYPIRTGLANRVLSANDSRGLSKEEITIAEILKQQDYRTALIGKWHLGDHQKYWPTEHGFDEYFGILHSNDTAEQALYRNQEIVSDPIDQQNLTLDFTREAVNFVERNSDRSFFLFLAMTAPHIPLLPSEKFSGTSKAGAYGDTVEELDWSVGEILKTLARLNLDERTLVIFTSDNGPFPEGSTGGLRGGKGTGWDGAYRVPFIARWMNHIPANIQSSAISMNIDLLPTLANIAGGNVPGDRPIDGKNIFSLLQASGQSPHEVLYFFNNERIAALRTQEWRIILSDYPPWRDEQPTRFEGDSNQYTLMYDMKLAPDQQFDISRDYPVEKQRLFGYLQMGRRDLESLSTLPDSEMYNIRELN